MIFCAGGGKQLPASRGGWLWLRVLALLLSWSVFWPPDGIIVSR
uniref:Uncharacterized protein n=1 Tax=Siphoviridae sp. ctMRT7 TaxID=2827855 RepID=A0A8S5SRT2_9CAUD|nr:MAG TPA: hypothetical protein [Siphoviridae sp. ctMRT7]